jgi:hypothetical protein
MAVAYSGRNIIFETIRADTAAHAFVELESILLRAVWTIDRTLTGGVVYNIISPDTVDLKAKVLIQDDVHYKIDNPLADLYNIRSLVIRVMNYGETVKSFEYQIRTDGVFTSFQVVAGFSQLFISVPGFGAGGHASFACGIPYIPLNSDPCLSTAAPVVDDIWWACGGSQFAFDWRAQANCYACMTYYRNGVAVIAPDNNSISPTSGYLCLFPLTAPNTYSTSQISWPTITYSSNQPLNIDAFIGWEWMIHGQLWDAFLRTAAVGRDTLDSFVDEFDGSAFNIHTIAWHSEFFSSLMLITQVDAIGSGNVAY